MALGSHTDPLHAGSSGPESAPSSHLPAEKGAQANGCCGHPKSHATTSPQAPAIRSTTLRAARRQGKDAPRSHNAFLRPEEPTVRGRSWGGARTVPRPPRSLLLPCGRREKCTAGGCGVAFLERGRTPGPFAFCRTGSALHSTRGRQIGYKEIFVKCASSYASFLGPEHFGQWGDPGVELKELRPQSWGRLEGSPADKGR